MWEDAPGVWIQERPGSDRARTAVVVVAEGCRRAAGKAAGKVAGKAAEAAEEPPQSLGKDYNNWPPVHSCCIPVNRVVGKQEEGRTQKVKKKIKIKGTKETSAASSPFPKAAKSEGLHLAEPKVSPTSRPATAARSMNHGSSRSMVMLQSYVHIVHPVGISSPNQKTDTPAPRAPSSITIG